MNTGTRLGLFAAGVAVVFVAAFGIAGTWWLGSRVGWNTAPGTLPPAPPIAAAPADGGASSPHSMTTGDIQGMVQTLAARMDKEPDNVEGWLMLGRSYAVLGQFEPAVAAYLQPLRALEVLERIGTPEARTLVVVVAAGAPGALLTREAQLVLERWNEATKTP